MFERLLLDWSSFMFRFQHFASRSHSSRWWITFYVFVMHAEKGFMTDLDILQLGSRYMTSMNDKRLLNELCLITSS